MELKALLINCTLKKSPEKSNTEALINIAQIELEALGVETELIRLTDFNIERGTDYKMSDQDDWPKVFGKIKAADILIVGSPIWMGHTPSTTQQLIERLDSIFYTDELKDKTTGQYVTYNKVAGALVTGNEDGAHGVAAQVLWAMSEFGFTIPPNANSYWVGVAGPGKSYIEAGGEKHEYTNRGVLTMVHNLVYYAELLKKHPNPINMNELAEKAKKMSK